MGGTVRVIVDGREVEAPVGASVIDACDLAGVYVPRLCAYPGLEPVGDCGLCFVRLGLDEPSAAARRACSVAVAPGMVVDTLDDEARGFRLSSMKAILGDHPHVCLTCPDRDGCSRDDCTYGHPQEARCCGEFGRCEIARVAAYVGALESPPAYVPRGLGVTVDHTIRRDLDLCIGCGRCVAACATLEEAGDALELVETHTLVGAPGGRDIAAGSGVERTTEWQPQSYLGRHVAVPRVGGDLRASGCTFCGACVMVCPSGALAAEGPRGAAWIAKRRARISLRPPVLPPENRYAFTEDDIGRVPAREGVFVLFSDRGEVVQISGVLDMRRALTDLLVAGPAGGVTAFRFEEAPLYTQRESELLARHLQTHGSMPEGNVGADDLFPTDGHEGA